MNGNGWKSSLSDTRLWILLATLIAHGGMLWWRVGSVESQVQETKNNVAVVSVQVADLRVKAERGTAEREAILDRVRRIENEFK